MSAAVERPRWRRAFGWLFGSWLASVVTMVVIFAAVFAAPSVYYERSGNACASCHEIWQPYTDWHSSTHRNVPCSSCHGDVLTLSAGFHINNMRRVFSHVRGKVPDRPLLKNADVLAMTARCQSCHQQEFAAWRSSRHSATYSDIFLDLKRNQKQKLIDDCLRCHAMHFQGGIRDLVTPVNTQGPWRLKQPELAQAPAVPCLACHQVHREGIPLQKSDRAAPSTTSEQEVTRPSLAFFDRRQFDHIAVADLPFPAMLEGARSVKMSPDQRQALCYQCHSPVATREVYSGDDRTPIGVHEGLSCFSCHQQHGQQTRVSCKTCHSQHQACRLDVEKMDTTFKDKSSKHNIHSVKCVDCHDKGVPKVKMPLVAQKDKMAEASGGRTHR